MSDMRDDIASVLLSAEEIQARTAELGAQISKDFDGREPLFVGVLKGCFVFMADLMRSVTIPCSVDFMAVSSYGNQTTTTGAVKINKDLNQDIEGRDIILVEDILDSGVTLHYLADYLSVRRPASITIATLLDKPDRRNPEHNLTVDYHCFKIPDEFVVGYGLDFAEKYRNLPARRTNKSADFSPKKDKIFVKMDFSAHVIRLYGYTPQQADGAGTEGGCSH